MVLDVVYGSAARIDRIRIYIKMPVVGPLPRWLVLAGGGGPSLSVLPGCAVLKDQ